LAEGLSKNQLLQTLLLSDNNLSELCHLEVICKALQEHKGLNELDLVKCQLNSESIKPLAKLLAAKYKLRTLNISNNSITDEGSRELLGAVQLNPYLIKFRMELNPTRTQLTKEIEMLCMQN
jgi:Ran GTPase-activating protein (RanGAP) involved in mRNA processing and transport